jgi:hypothetical protein
MNSVFHIISLIIESALCFVLGILIGLGSNIKLLNNENEYNKHKKSQIKFGFFNEKNILLSFFYGLCIIAWLSIDDKFNGMSLVFLISSIVGFFVGFKMTSKQTESTKVIINICSYAVFLMVFDTILFLLEPSNFSYFINDIYSYFFVNIGFAAAIIFVIFLMIWGGVETNKERF